MAQADDKEADVLLQRLRKLIEARCFSASGKVDGGKEKSGPVAGQLGAVEVPQQKELPSSKTGVPSPGAELQQLSAPSPSSSAVPEPLPADKPLPNSKSADVVSAPKVSNPLLLGLESGSADLLRRELAASLSQRFGGGSRSYLHKRFYDMFGPDHGNSATAGIGIPVTNSADFITFPAQYTLLNAIPQWSNASPEQTCYPTRRLGSAVRLHELDLFLQFRRNPSTTLVAPEDPLTIPQHLRIIIFLDLVPLTPSIPPVAIADDGSIGYVPTPGLISTYALYSRLGQASTNGFMNMYAVRNPTSAPLYHVLYDDWVSLTDQPSSQETANTPPLVPTVHSAALVKYHKIKVDMKGIELIYPITEPNAAPQINNLWFFVCSDKPLGSSPNPVCYMYGSWSLSFTDITVS